MSRSSENYNPERATYEDDEEDEHTFDSPLQTSLHKLSQLRARLAGKGAGMRSELRAVEHIIELLHSPDLLNSQPLDELIAGGKVQTDEQLKNWLEAMEWMRKDKDERGSGLVSTNPSARSSEVRKSVSRMSRYSKMSSFTEDEGSGAGGGSASGGSSSGLLDGIGEDENAHGMINPTLRKELLPENESKLIELLEYRMSEWEFNCHQLNEYTNGHPVCAFGWAVSERHGLRSALNIKAPALQALLQRVEAGYLSVPYHNAAHAACVTHGVYHLLTQRNELSELFGSPIDLFSCILAGLVHDLGHTGHNNAFHVASGSDLAILYSDQSVLEMHHLASAFQILKDKECDVLASLSDEAKKEVRIISSNRDTAAQHSSTAALQHCHSHPPSFPPAAHLQVRSRIIGMVLATDLSVNFPTINLFKQMVVDKSAELEKLNAEKAAAAEPSSAALTAEVSAGASPRRSFKDVAVVSSTPSLPVGSSSSDSVGSPTTKASRKTLLREQLSNAAQWQAGGIQVTPSEELLILKMLLKVSDIGNVTKGKEYCLEWTERVVQEFFAQGDLEAELKLPVTPFMDRNTAVVPKQQLGFYNFVAKPMFEALDGLVSMAQPLGNLDIMYAHWSAQLPPEEKPPEMQRKKSQAP